MKRLSIIVALTLGLASVNASAQWYLFPGFSKKQKDTTVVKVVQPVDTVVAVPIPLADSLASVQKEFIPGITRPIGVGLLLPFRHNGTTSASMMDFYCGALLAVRDLGKEGLSIRLNVYDCSDGSPGIPEQDFPDTDVLIGPVAVQDLEKQLELHPEGKFFISPLDAQAEPLTECFPVIQASAGTDRQILEAVAWLSKELTASDKVIVVEESGVSRTDYSEKLFSALDNSGIRYEILSYGILQGLHIGSEFVSKSSLSGVTRFVIASENESFVGDAVRNIALLQYRGNGVALYGTSKLRAYQSIEQEDFHTVGLRLAATFHTDYSQADVKSFILAYRTLFESEPSSFAFNGYDVTRFFTSICARVGSDWGLDIGGQNGTGLYSDFSFERKEGCKGAYSTAVKHLLYNPDNSITLTD